MPGMAPALNRDYPEVESFTRYFGRGKRLYRKDDTQLIVEMSVCVDSTFLEIFDFEMIAGDPQTALDLPYSIVVTEETARKFFGHGDPMGQVLTMDGDAFKVTGVLQNLPEHVHMQFDILISMGTVTGDNPDFNEQFGSNFLVTYLLMQQGADITALESKMPDFLLRCMPPDPEDNGTVNDFYKLYFQQLPEVHLSSMDIEHDYHNYRKFNGSYLGVFTLVGLLILIIATVNFMNLITARASHRWKEVGVRKTVGALKMQMFSQFALESVLLGFFAFLIGMVLAFGFTPVLNELLDRTLSFGYFLEHPMLLLVALASTLLLGFLAGIYPSYYLASFDAVSILRGGNIEDQKSIFHSSLVVLQFGLAIAMIVCTFIVVQQLYYIENKDIGLDKDHMLLVDMNQEANDLFETLKTELLASSNVLGVTASGQRLGNNFHQWGFKLRTDTVKGLTPSNVNVDYDYLDVYDIELIKGRGFSKDRPLDDGYGFIINESFAKEIDIEDPIGISAGHSWYPDDSLGTIIGVVKDFNFNSLHYAVNTLSMVVHTDWGYDEMSVKVNGDNIEASIADVERIWNSLVPGWPFQYAFLDTHFQELYVSDRQMKSVVTMMAILAILIACMGLFGLSAITVERKVKEIGIRKILGASIGQIMVHLSRHFALMVFIAFLLFSPITYMLMKKWLEKLCRPHIH